MFPDHLPIFDIDLDCQFQSSDNKFPAFHASKTPLKNIEIKTILYKQQQNFTLYSNIGKRKDNLDRGFWIKSDKMNMLALLDGHCDPQPINYLQKHLLNRLSKHPKIISETQTAIAEVFEELQRQVIQSYEKGSTALIVILFQKQMVVANLGDSILYGINVQNRIQQLTTIHNLTNSGELMQVINQGGIILKKGDQYRINGQLNLSRSFGDRKLKYCMSSKPDMYRFLRKDYKRIVLASDGFYKEKQADKRLLLQNLQQLQSDETTYLDNASAIYINL